MTRIGLIDYGAGNFASVRNALRYLGLSVVEVRCHEDFDKATHLVLPGVGTFASAMRRLVSSDLVDLLHEFVIRQRKPFLGICVGMQLLANAGSEFEICPGLGFIQGTVEKVNSGPTLRLPHIGWNTVTVRRSSRLFAYVNEAPTFYFVHSYHVVPSHEPLVTATCWYGTDVTAAIEQDNVFGVQFHPEKSQQDGLLLLKHFASL